MPGLTGFVLGSIITAIALFFFFGCFFIEAEEKAYKKGYRDGSEIKNNRMKCEFTKCQHYLTCNREKGEVCENFAECKTYMDAYDNDIRIWKEIHDWGEEDYE